MPPMNIRCFNPTRLRTVVMLHGQVFDKPKQWPTKEAAKAKDKTE